MDTWGKCQWQEIIVGVHPVVEIRAMGIWEGIRHRTWKYICSSSWPEFVCPVLSPEWQPYCYTLLTRYDLSRTSRECLAVLYGEALRRSETRAQIASHTPRHHGGPLRTRFRPSGVCSRSHHCSTDQGDYFYDCYHSSKDSVNCVELVWTRIGCDGRGERDWRWKMSRLSQSGEMANM